MTSPHPPRYGAPPDDRDDYSAHGGDALTASALRRVTSHKDVRWPTDDEAGARDAIKQWAQGVKDR